MNAHKNSAILLVFALTILGYCSINIGLPAYPALERYFHVDESLMRLTMTVFLCGDALAQFFWGTISDHYGRRRIALIATSITLLGTLLTVFAHTIDVFTVGRFIEAIGVSFTPVIGRAILADCCNERELQIYVAYNLVIAGLMPAIAPMIGGHLLVLFNWQAAYYFLAVLAILVFAWELFLFKETNQKLIPVLRLKKVCTTYRSLLANRTFMRYLLSYALIFGGLLSFYTITPYIFIRGLNLSAHHYGFWLFFIGGGYIAGNLLTSFLTYKFNPSHLLKTGYALLILAVFLLLGFSMAHIFNVASVVIPMVSYTFGCGFISPVSNASAIRAVQLEQRGTAAAFLGASVMVMSTLLSAVLTQFMITNLWPVMTFLLGIVSGALCFIVMFSPR